MKRIFVNLLKSSAIIPALFLFNGCSTLGDATQALNNFWQGPPQGPPTPEQSLEQIQNLEWQNENLLRQIQSNQNFDRIREEFNER